MADLLITVAADHRQDLAGAPDVHAAALSLLNEATQAVADYRARQSKDATWTTTWHRSSLAPWKAG
jgi:hypothetical protein